MKLNWKTTITFIAQLDQITCSEATSRSIAIVPLNKSALLCPIEHLDTINLCCTSLKFTNMFKQHNTFLHNSMLNPVTSSNQILFYIVYFPSSKLILDYTIKIVYLKSQVSNWGLGVRNSFEGVDNSTLCGSNSVSPNIPEFYFNCRSRRWFFC